MACKHDIAPGSHQRFRIGPRRERRGRDLEIERPETPVADDGLTCYRAILPDLTRILASDGFVILEFGQGQGPSVRHIAEASGLSLVEFRNDLNGIERAVILNKI